MYSNYKNFERARYLLIRDFFKQKDISDMNKNKSEGTLFSGICSAILSYVINNMLSYDESAADVFSVISRCLLITIIYTLSFVAFKALYHLWLLIADGIRVNKNSDSLSDYEGYVKDFDNIACDSLIMVLGYQQNIATLPTNDILIKHFNLYEMVHYLELTYTITQRLVNKKDECINFGDMANNRGVEIYRVKNMILMLEQLTIEVLGLYKSFNLNDKLLESKIDAIEKGLPEILNSL